MSEVKLSEVFRKIMLDGILRDSFYPGLFCQQHEDAILAALRAAESPSTAKAVLGMDSQSDPATCLIEELLHTMPYYVMEYVRQNWIAIAAKYLHAARKEAVEAEREACAVAAERQQDSSEEEQRYWENNPGLRDAGTTQDAFDRAKWRIADAIRARKEK